MFWPSLEQAAVDYALVCDLEKKVKFLPRLFLFHFSLVYFIYPIAQKFYLFLA